MSAKHAFTHSDLFTAQYLIKHKKNSVYCSCGYVNKFSAKQM